VDRFPLLADEKRDKAFLSLGNAEAPEECLQRSAKLEAGFLIKNLLPALHWDGSDVLLDLGNGLFDLPEGDAGQTFAGALFRHREPPGVVGSTFAA
jgi:hypothetical protein